MQRWLIIGSGDVAQRMVAQMRRPQQLFCLCRDDESALRWRRLGAIPLRGDLDQPATLKRLSGLATVVFHFAPPPAFGMKDTRTQHLVAALSQGKSLPQSLIYISTTGVYGDCQGQQIDEVRPVRPQTDRARRRVDAEQILRRFGRRTGCRIVILRAPGIYAAERLPLGRLRQQPVVPLESQDPWTNHVHALDLAQAAWRAQWRGGPQRVYNVVDDTRLTLGDYYALLALHFGLTPPARLPLETIREQVGEMNWSFMRESRQIANHRIKRELAIAWYYPSVRRFLATLSGAVPEPSMTNKRV